MNKAQSEQIRQAMDTQSDKIARALSMRYPAIAITIPSIIEASASLISFTIAMNIIAKMKEERNEK